MSQALPWLIGAVLLAYTAGLVALSGRGQKSAGNGESFLHGGRQFGFRHVFILVTVMWASSIFVVELETGFLSGLSAIWFGLSVIVMSVLVAQFLLKPFARAGYLTNSRLIGQRYGVAAQRFSGSVIALTFPIFAMSNVLAAAEFIHALLGWNLALTLSLTTVIMLLYVWRSGLWSLAYTQALNLGALTVGLAVASYYFWRIPASALHPVHVHGFFTWGGVGLSTIAVWVVMNVLNSVSAQAEMQTIAAVRDPRRGQLAVYVSAAVLIVFTIVPVWLGMKTRELYPKAAQGLAAFPHALFHVAPTWAIALVALGVWASALSWCAPLLFSGAASFGADIFGGGRAKSTDGLPTRSALDVRTLTRYGLLLQGILVVVVSLLRPDELAWWRVFGQTIRSGAIFAPTVAYFLWPLATRRAVLVSMLAGVVTSLVWNAATGFSATVFLLQVNPMWIGLSVGIVALVVTALFDPAQESIAWRNTQASLVLLTLTGVILATLLLTWFSIPALRGALACLGIVSGFLALTRALRGKDEKLSVAPTHLAGGAAEAGAAREKPA